MNWKTLLKIAVSGLIVWLVLRAIDPRQLADMLRRANPLWLLWAMAWFVVSKLVAAERFRALLGAGDIRLSRRSNLELYWLGMYYNLLLPGGVSGDGYKIKILMDAFGKPFRPLFSLTLYDRLSGMLALGQLAVALACLLPPLQPWWPVWLLGLMLSVPVSWWLFVWLVNTDRNLFWGLNVQSLAVQGAQLVCALGLMFALGEGASWIGYSLIFLVSSVAAMLPLTIGGTGARELTFLWGAKILNLDAEKSVAVAFLFYLLSTAVSLGGMWFSFRKIKDLS
ncbi:MAG TPA: lysylphosphatidylglycerol synthase transmembrane domain-containing protein [Saprospiraceae bacterium]|nr:lysylphosphatidylglycerol synthase transmembrane domain-containing protein [Saprospiraceae bacterium]HNM26501.1 lysylphosphatidylglycerol synthase transmembrane domain-containing protein [Saprospiraceae bacterium]